MSSSALQHTVQIRPSRLAGLLVAVAALTAATTWSASRLADAHDGSKPAPGVAASPALSSKAYVDNVVALTGEQRAAIFGNVSASEQHVKDIVALSPSERAAVYGNVLVSTGAP